MLGAPQSDRSVSLIEEVLAQMDRPPVTEEFIDKVAMGLALAVETEQDVQTISTLLHRLPDFHELSEINQERVIEAFSKAIELCKLEVLDEFLSSKHEVKLSAENILYGLIEAQKGKNKETIEKLGVALAASPANLGEDLDVAHDLYELVKALMNSGHIDLVREILDKHFAAISQYNNSLVKFCLENHQGEMLYYFIDKDLNFKSLPLNEVISGLLAWFKSAKEKGETVPREVITTFCMVVDNNAEKLPQQLFGEVLLYLREANCIREIRELITKHARTVTAAQLESCLFHALEGSQAQMVSMFVEHMQKNHTVWDKLPWAPSLRMFEHVVDNLKLDLLERLLESQHNEAFMTVIKRVLNYAAGEKRLEAIACIFEKVPEFTFDEKDEVVKAAPEDFQPGIIRIIDEEKERVRRDILVELELRKVKQKVDKRELTSHNIDQRLHSAITALEATRQIGTESVEDLDAVVMAMNNLQLQQYKVQQSRDIFAEDKSLAANDAAGQLKEKDKTRLV
ncbi:MAG: hypothetical protein JSR17_05175 [Proteobacteria bacterium]|nr:hypothetical protein [Pseudomonadota bacterium]